MTDSIKDLYQQAEEAIDALEKALIEAGKKPSSRSAASILGCAYAALYPTPPQPDMHQVTHD